MVVFYFIHQHRKFRALIGLLVKYAVLEIANAHGNISQQLLDEFAHWLELLAEVIILFLHKIFYVRYQILEFKRQFGLVSLGQYVIDLAFSLGQLRVHGFDLLLIHL